MLFRSFKFGNPSNFNKKLFYSFSNKFIEDPYTWSKYTEKTPTALPSAAGGVTLAISEINYPNEWKALKTYVGFSEIPELSYKDSGSFITDFFIDLNVDFSVENIKNFAPIIKIYATQKLNKFQSGTMETSLPETQFVGLIIQIFTLNDGSTVTIYKQNENKFALLRDFGQKTLYVGPQVSIELNPSNDNIVNQAITEVYGKIGRAHV